MLTAQTQPHIHAQHTHTCTHTCTLTQCVHTYTLPSSSEGHALPAQAPSTPCPGLPLCPGSMHTQSSWPQGLPGCPYSIQPNCNHPDLPVPLLSVTPQSTSRGSKEQVSSSVQRSRARPPASQGGRWLAWSPPAGAPLLRCLCLGSSARCNALRVRHDWVHLTRPNSADMSQSHGCGG